MIVGEAHVVVRAIGDKLKDDIQKQIEDAAVGAGKDGGKKGGQALGESMSDTIDRDSDKTFKPLVDGAEKAGTTAGRRAGRRFVDNTKKTIVDSSPDLERLGGGIGNRIGKQMNNGFARARFNRVIVGAGVKLSVLIPIIGAIAGGLSTIISGLYAVIATLGTAINSSMALVGVLGALGQGLVFAMIGFGGVGEALKNAFDPKKAKEFNAAMAKLTPEARKFVRQIQSMRKGFLEIREITSKNMFPGIVRGLKDLAILFPAIRIGAREAGLGVGEMFEEFANQISTDEFRTSLTDVFKNNRPIMAEFGKSLGNVTRLLVALLDAAGPLTARFSAWFDGWTDYLATSAEAGNQTGRLTAYFEKAGDAMALWGRITHNFVEGLYEIGKVSSKSGYELLDVLDKATQRMANFTDSAENVKKLETYFDNVKDNFISISVLIKEIGAAFGRLGADKGVKKTADALAAIVPELEEALSKSIETIGPKLAELAGEILELFIVLEESNAISNAISVFTGVAKAINAILSVPGIKQFAGIILGIAAAVKALSIVAKLGGFMFSPLISHMGAVQQASSSMWTGLKNTGSQMGRMRRAFDLGYAFSDNTSKAGKAMSGLGASAVSAGQGFKSAGAGVKTFMANNRSTVRGIASVGLIMASTRTESKLLSSALMGAGFGAMLGPWGAAAGALAGVSVAAYDTRKNLKELAKLSKEEMGDLGIPKLQEHLDSIADTKKWGSFTKEFGIAGMGYETLFPEKDMPDISPLSGLVDKYFVDPANKEEKRIREVMRKLQDAAVIDREIGTAINFEQARDDVSEFIKSVNKEGEKLKLNIDTQMGRDVISLMDRLGKDAKAVGGQKAINTAAKDIKGAAVQAGASEPRSQMLAAGILNHDKRIKGISDEVLVKIDADDSEFLRKAGISQMNIDRIKKGAKARLDADDKASEKAKKVSENIKGVKGKTVELKAEKKGTDPVKFGEAISNISGKKVSLSIKAAFSGLSKKAKEILGLAQGGWVNGPGSPTSDSIPTMLSDGEFVVKAKQAAKYGTLLEAVNDDRALPKAKFPESGKVSSSSSRSGGMRIVAGELSLSPDGRAFISGVADDVYNGNDDFDRKIRGN